MRPLDPVDTLPLFAPLREQLLALLHALAPDDWDRPTVAGAWRVRDVVAHLLDGDLRRVSATRDAHVPQRPHPIRTPADIARLVNTQNASGVAWSQRLSPRVMTDLLAVTGPWVEAHLASTAPDAPAAFAVSWAGESSSAHWMDVAREYTERWHHQQQVRSATARPLLLEPTWCAPVLSVAVRALPPAFTHTLAPAGTTIVLRVDGPTTGAWSLVREPDTWRLFEGAAPSPAAEVTLDTDAAWRLLFGGHASPDATERAVVRGDASLVAPLYEARAIVR